MQLRVHASWSLGSPDRLLLLCFFFPWLMTKKQVRGVPRGVLAAVHPGRAVPVHGVPHQQEQRKTFHAGIYIYVQHSICWDPHYRSHRSLRTNPLDRFLELDYSATKGLPTPNDTSPDSYIWTRSFPTPPLSALALFLLRSNRTLKVVPGGPMIAVVGPRGRLQRLYGG